MAQESLDSQPSNMYKATVEETGEQLVIPTRLKLEMHSIKTVLVSPPFGTSWDVLEGHKQITPPIKTKHIS